VPTGSIYFQDELRYGTRTDTQRRWMPQGERPTCPIKIGYQFGHLFTAICPYNGDLFAVFLPSMTTECFQLFTSQLLEHTGKATTLVLDKASCHKAAKAQTDLTLLFLPTAYPELNPVERFFKELRKQLKCRVFETLHQVEQRIELILHQYWQEPKLLIQTTLFPFLNTQQ
jgi:transposase-like protein